MPDTSANLRETIKARLIQRLRGYPLETRLPSIRVLAREFDAAYLTVNGVLKELEWEGYVQRVPRRGTFLASRERTVMKDVQTGTTSLKTVVFAYPNYFSYSTWSRVHHAEELAVKHRRALLEFKMNRDTTYKGLCDLVRGREDVCGVIVTPIPNTVDRAGISLFDSLGVPVVLTTPCDLVALGQRVWSVSTDWFRAGYLQAKYLLEAGHEALAYIQHEPTAPDRQEPLLRGMRQAMREAGWRQRDLIVADAKTQPWDDSREAAEEQTRKLLTGGQVTAAIYESFRGIQGGARAARLLGRRVPEDFNLVATGLGNDDETYFNPPITTVDPRPDAEIELVFACLLAPAKQHTKRLTVEPVLRVRADTRNAEALVERDEGLPGEPTLNNWHS